MAGLVSVVVGGQFGSEAKGAVAGYLASTAQNSSTRMWGGRSVICVRVGGPNAGHTTYGRCPEGCTDAHIKPRGDTPFTESHPWRLRQVPVAAVTNPDALLLVAAGSEVDLGVLRSEVSQLNSAGYQVSSRLHIDRSATVLEQKHITKEMSMDLTGRLGSTAKGIGAARADRIYRRASTIEELLPTELLGYQCDGADMLAEWLEYGAHVVIEGTQGYGLGLHTSYYPKTTSGDCRAIDFLAQAGVSPWAHYVRYLDIWVVARTYPIRVAGNSGPLRGETSWGELGLEPEQTTVTQKVRRVGEWDSALVNRAVLANGGGGNPNVRLALMMADYKIPEVKGRRKVNDLDEAAAEQLAKLVAEVERDIPATVGLVGTGPTSIIDLRTEGVGR